MGKRGNGEGSITRRMDGLHMSRYTIQTTQGAKRRTLYGKSRKEVADKLAKALSDREAGLAFDWKACIPSSFMSFSATLPSRSLWTHTPMCYLAWEIKLRWRWSAP